MDFNFTEEQQQLADAIRRWAVRDYGFETRQSIVHSPQGTSDAAWQQLAELGLPALGVPEQYGGFDGTTIDQFMVMQELGRALVVEPYFATAWGTWFLKHGNCPGLLEQVATGEIKLACAFGERDARYDMRAIDSAAQPSQDGYSLSGSKTVVIHGAQADILIVSARMAGEIAVFAVPAGSKGVEITGYRTIDGQRAANLCLSDVQLDASSLLGKGWHFLDEGLDVGTAILCAEAMGALQAIFDATLDYTKTRTQFGAPIGKFQALQHRMADMYIHLEQARSMALLAAIKAGSPDARERRRCVSAAKYRIGEAIRFIGQQAIQLHGGMGVTDELPAAHHFKRLTMIALTLGDADHHLKRFIEEGQ